MAKCDLTAEELRSIVSYDQETGEMVWRPRQLGGKATNWDTKYAGKTVGLTTNYGYRQARIHQQPYLVHRLAWLYVYGAWPHDELDHIDGNPLNNRVENLRLASRLQNMKNQKRRIDNTSGFKGVYRHGDVWRAKINVNGRQIHLGTFVHKICGHLAYQAAARKYFGEFARAA